MKRILLAGGDARALKLAQLMETDGYAVETLGLKPSDENEVHIEQADAVLFPYPFSVKAGRIPVLTDVVLRPEDVLQRLKKDTCILCGDGLAGYMPKAQSQWMKYTDADDFAQQNAELSAEAAVCETMLYSKYALKNRKILVMGYGLFGRSLALKLRALNAEVWVAARREAQRKLAAEEGMKAVSLQELDDILPQMHMILNTIPACVLDERHLKRMHPECCILEMASAPYGFDRELARTMGLSCIFLPGLPGRYSPDSAALILHEAVKQLLGRFGL